MGYMNALVFFIDILGSQDRDDFDILFEINRTFHGELEKNQSYDKPNTAYERKIYTFSDCAYIIYNFKEGIEEYRKDLRRLFDIALRNTEGLIVQFIKKGFLCRGGIAYGEVYYERERSLFFGPAVNRAHYFEDKVAVYPRIIMDEYIATEVILLDQERLDKASTTEGKLHMKRINGDIVKQDEDGNYYLHYLNVFELGNNFFEMQQMYEILNSLVACEIEKQQQNIKNNPDKQGKYKRIIDKYDWLKKYMDNSRPEQNSGAVTLPCQP
jgi:hypothetical protein